MIVEVNFVDCCSRKGKRKMKLELGKTYITKNGREMTVYDAEGEQNLFYNMTQDFHAPSLGEKRC